MTKLTKDEMIIVTGGGTTISGSFMNAFYKTIEIIYSIGESFGSYIRRTKEGKICKL